MVKLAVAIGKPRVRFPADAVLSSLFVLLVLRDSVVEREVGLVRVWTRVVAVFFWPGDPHSPDTLPRLCT